MDARDQRVVDGIAKYGWYVIKVPKDDEGPGFAFTMGLLKNFNHPEVIVTGLDLDTMHGMLNTIGDSVKAGGRYEPGQRVTQVIEGFPVELRAVEESYHKPYFGYALWYHRHYGTGAFRAIQCVWPAKNGAFPWEPAFPRVALRQQPLLFAAG